MYFTTTRLHQELAGGTFVDVIIDEAHDPRREHPFKGNVDLDKLAALIAGRRGEHRLRQPRGTVNMAGGQPVSMANMKALRALCDRARDPGLPRRHAHGRERLLHPAARAGVREQDRRADPARVLRPTPTARG
jgi:hypothetical protein